MMKFYRLQKTGKWQNKCLQISICTHPDTDSIDFDAMCDV